MRLTAEQVVDRARRSCGKRTIYKLAMGGMNPEAEHPAVNRMLDCSGFAAWCLGISRDQTGKFPGNWIETTRVRRDALSTQKYFAMVTAARPGDVIVYGDQGGKEGHIGIITEVTPQGKPAKIVHCNAGSKDAIVEEPPKLFWFKKKAIYARPLFLVPETPAVPVKPKVEPRKPILRPITVRSGDARATGYIDDGDASYLPTRLVKAALLAAGWRIEYTPGDLRIDPPVK